MITPNTKYTRGTDHDMRHTDTDNARGGSYFRGCRGVYCFMKWELHISTFVGDEYFSDDSYYVLMRLAQESTRAPGATAMLYSTQSPTIEYYEKGTCKNAKSKIGPYGARRFDR